MSELTGFKEMLDGRVKTLHPVIQGGILALRDNTEHMKELLECGIHPIDLVAVNLYPFLEKVNETLDLQQKLEFIDIGGPSMIRAAAKNFKDVLVLTNPEDYKKVMDSIEEGCDFSPDFRKNLAGKAFNLTSAYDAAISTFLLEENFPEYLALPYQKQIELRYGENSHQTAAFYSPLVGSGAMKNFIQLGGKELSYNNIKDMDAAWKVVSEFEEVACCAVKHNSPCGAAVGNSSQEAYTKTFNCDPKSIFGGIVAFNSVVDLETSKELICTFLEVIIAKDYTAEALEILRTKKNLRIIKCSLKPSEKLEITSVDGGILIQERDDKLIDKIICVTDRKPSEQEYRDLIFGMKIVKHVNSNAIVIVKDGRAAGIGGGQVNRIWSAMQALDRANEGVVLASDGFFPFEDIVEEAAKYSIKAIIQPGGSIRDKDSIDCCNKNEISMLFTGIRHFKH